MQSAAQLNLQNPILKSWKCTSQRMKARVDQILNKWLSRKLLVFVTSAIALFAGKIPGDSWVIIATAYIGTEGVIDAVTRLRGINYTQSKK